MSIRFVGAFAAAVVAAGLTSSLVLADQGGSSSSSAYYYYFKEPVPLGVDLDRIAVFERRSEAGGPRAVGAAEVLSRYGVDTSSLQASVIEGLAYAATPASVQDESALEALVASVASDEEIEFVSPVFTDAEGDPVLMTRHLHVGFEGNVTVSEAEEILREFGVGQIEARHYSGMPNVFRLKSDSRDGFEVLSLANALAQHPAVTFAESDMVLTSRRQLIPIDPYFDQQWGLHNTGQDGGTADMDMDGPEAWDLTTGESDMLVLILDDGIEQDHPDIHQATGIDFTGQGTGGNPGNQCDNHGTAVAGCVSAFINNGIGGTGIAPNCRVVAGRYSVSNVGDPCPNNGTFQISWLVDALQWAVDNGARVTNNSSGFTQNSTVSTKYTSTRAAGVVHFSSSGNTGESGIGYPASLASVIAVGACNRDGNRASFSTYGSGIAFVAPGKSILTTDRTGSDGYAGGDYSTVDGTSFSSPYAAGVAALVLTVNSELTPAEVEAIMKDTCVDRGDTGYDLYFGYGIVNAYEAVRSAMASANDQCSSAIWVCSTGSPYTGSTTYADSDGSASCGDSADSPDVWYAYTPIEDGSVTANACEDAGYDGVLSAHTGCPGTEANELACDDDACGQGLPSIITFDVTAGETYLIRVSGWNGHNGDFTLNLTGPECVPPDTTPPSPNPPIILSGSPYTYGSGPTEVTLTAQESTDASPPVEYRFTAVGGTGHSGSWGTVRTYVDTNLQVNTTYSYQLQTRDSAWPANLTEYSAIKYVATAALRPGAPILSNPTYQSMQVDVVPDDDVLDNPVWTPYAIYCVSTSDSNWIGKYVSVSGTPSTNPAWQGDSSWGNMVVHDLIGSTSYTWVVKARNLDGLETAFGPSATLTTAEAPIGACCLGDASCALMSESACVAADGLYQGDEAPCTPDPCPPMPCPAEILDGYPYTYSNSPTEITMTAVEADDATPPIEYMFLCFSGSCHSSTWSEDLDYVDTGLSPNYSYSYRVRARDGMDPPNETSVNDAQSVTVVTHALVPGAPILGGATDYTMTLDVVPDDDVLNNPTWTTYAIQCVTTSDAAWNGKYVAASGNPTASAVWQTDAVWGVITLQGMQPGRSYTFAVKARNLAMVETALGPTSTLSTTGGSSGACCVGSSCTVETPGDCTAMGGIYQGDGTTCSPSPCCEMSGDVNGDLVVDARDIQCFIDCLLDGSAPGCVCACGDVDGSPGLDVDDLADFVNLLLGV